MTTQQAAELLLVLKAIHTTLTIGVYAFCLYTGCWISMAIYRKK